MMAALETSPNAAKASRRSCSVAVREMFLT